MDNEFNSLLESVGIDMDRLQWSNPRRVSARVAATRAARMWTEHATPDEANVADSCPAPESTPEPTPQNLSDEDFNDILQDNGVELEEETDEEERDLDAEEDEDWEALERAGAIRPAEHASDFSEGVIPRRSLIDHIESMQETDHSWEGFHTGDGLTAQIENMQELSTVNREALERMVETATVARNARGHGESITSMIANAMENTIGVLNVTDEGEITMQGPDGEPVVVASTAVEEDIAPARMRLSADNINTVANQPIEAEPSDEDLISQGIIPQNSPTLLMDESTTRFSGAEWFSEIQKQRIIVAGQGGIGSWVTLQLARMTPSAIFLYDDDTVETVNMAGQLYSRDDVGMFKVDAIESMIRKYSNIQNVYAIKDRFTEETEAGDVMICGFDNMVARRTFFNSWQIHVFSKPKDEWHKCLFLDGRLSMGELQIFCITGDNDYAMTEYKDKYLFDDSEAEHTVCSMKQTTYLACMIGSLMVNLFTNFVAGLLDPIIPYDLPFFTAYDAQNMIFKTEN